MAWAGASGGAHGRRRGAAAAGRFGALWLVAVLGDALDDWPLPLDELGAIAGELRWCWWDAHEPLTGWQLQLAVESPADGLAWALTSWRSPATQAACSRSLAGARSLASATVCTSDLYPPAPMPRAAVILTAGLALAVASVVAAGSGPVTGARERP